VAANRGSEVRINLLGAVFQGRAMP